MRLRRRACEGSPPVHVFRTWYGPVHRAFAALAPDRRRNWSDLVALVDEFNVSGDSTMVVPGEYLEVVVACRH